jgi:hypothetical protein
MADKLVEYVEDGTEPVWYTLSEVIVENSLSTEPWQELMALAQILHDLRIHDTNQLMRKLDAVYVADDNKPLRGEYHYFDDDTTKFTVASVRVGHDPTSEFAQEVRLWNERKEAKEEPRMSNRRQAIMAQKERKNESS